MIHNKKNYITFDLNIFMPIVILYDPAKYEKDEIFKRFIRPYFKEYLGTWQHRRIKSDLCSFDLNLRRGLNATDLEEYAESLGVKLNSTAKRDTFVYEDS